MSIKLLTYDKNNKLIKNEEVKWLWIPEEDDHQVLVLQQQSKDILIALELENGLKIMVKEEK
jgi:hypothetical protein